MRSLVRRLAERNNLPNPLEIHSSNKATSLSGKEWVTPELRPPTHKKPGATPSSKGEAEWEPLLSEDTSELSIPPNVAEPVELEMATTEATRVEHDATPRSSTESAISDYEATPLPSTESGVFDPQPTLLAIEQAIPPPAEQSSQQTERPTPPIEDAASQALAAAQVQDANVLLQQLRPAKSKQAKRVPNTQKRTQPQPSLSFLESEEAQSMNTDTNLSSAPSIEEPRKAEQGNNSRLGKFFGGWF
ncbi:hypothetical protein L218DRAFT_519586 [Marasmius fiardii PR-910]|nr:hypothetical protein L218DRAFT_519586 [Marasmius fiardii PR-910]